MKYFTDSSGHLYVSDKCDTAPHGRCSVCSRSGVRLVKQNPAKVVLVGWVCPTASFFKDLKFFGEFESDEIAMGLWRL